MQKRLHAKHSRDQALNSAISQLSHDEKAKTCQSLAKEIKQLRRKVRCNSDKLATQQKKKVDDAQQSFLSYSKASSFLDSCEIQGITLLDIRAMLTNLSKIIADGRLQMTSLNFKQIATLIRTHLTKEKLSSYSRKTDKKVQLLFPERELIVSESEI